MTTATTETKSGGRGGARGPRTYKDKPTDRERVLTTSLSEKVKELTGRDVSPETCRAVRWTFSRWYEDPKTKELFENMDAELKRAKAQAKYEAAQAALKEAQAELGDVDLDSDDDTDDASFEESEGDSADEADDDEDEDEDVFDSDSKVSASF